MNATSTRADRVTGVVLTGIGLAVTVGAVLMDRLAERSIDPWTVPGMVPGILGAVLALLGLVLALRPAAPGAAPAAAAAPPEAPAAAAEDRQGRRLVWFGLALCGVYAIGLVGRLPFWLASILFVFTFTAALEWDAADPPPARARKLAVAAVLAVATGVGVHLLFQDLFLVRMP